MTRLIKTRRWDWDCGRAVRYEVQTFSRPWWFPFVRIWRTSFSTSDLAEAQGAFAASREHGAGGGFVVLGQTHGQDGALSLEEGPHDR